jgi:putative intracellular protease/amidase
MDPKSAEEFKDDEICKEFLQDEEPMDLLQRTLTPSSIDPQRYMLIFYAGGHGPMFDLHNCEDMNKLASGIYELGGIVGKITQFDMIWFLM